MNELARHAEELPRDRPVLLYCRGGNRSGDGRRGLAPSGLRRPPHRRRARGLAGRRPAARARGRRGATPAAGLLMATGDQKPPVGRTRHPRDRLAGGRPQSRPRAHSRPPARGRRPRRRSSSRSRACAPGSPSSTAGSGSAASRVRSALVLALAAGIVGVVLAVQAKDESATKDDLSALSAQVKPSDAGGVAGRRGRRRRAERPARRARDAGELRSPPASGPPTARSRSVRTTSTSCAARSTTSRRRSTTSSLPIRRRQRRH